MLSSCPFTESSYAMLPESGASSWVEMGGKHSESYSSCSDAKSSCRAIKSRPASFSAAASVTKLCKARMRQRALPFANVESQQSKSSLLGVSGGCCTIFPMGATVTEIHCSFCCRRLLKKRKDVDNQTSLFMINVLHTNDSKEKSYFLICTSK